AVDDMWLPDYVESCSPSCRSRTNVCAGAVRKRVGQAAKSVQRTAVGVGEKRAAGNVDLYAERVSHRNRVHRAISVVRVAGRGGGIRSESLLPAYGAAEKRNPLELRIRQRYNVCEQPLNLRRNRLAVGR